MTQIIIFIAAAGGIALLANLVLPMLIYRARLRNRDRWASANGFQRCEDQGRSGLDDVALPLLKTRGLKILSCLQRGSLTLLDVVYTQSVGDRPTDSVDVRRAVTAVLVELTGDAPFVTVRPQGQRIPRFMLNQFVRIGVRYRSVVEALFASIPTGDYAFDSAFRVLGDDEVAVRKFLRPELRTVMMAHPGFSYEMCGRHAVVFASGLVFDDRLEQLIETAEAGRSALT